MSRTGITFDDVESAALFLQAQGKTPTIESIRMKLGTGSNSTIQSLLQRFKAKQQTSSLLPLTPDLLPPELHQLVNQLWHALQEKANVQTKELMEQHEKSLDQLNVQMTKYRESNRQWQTMHDQWVKEKENFQSAIVQLNESLVVMKIDATNLQSDFALQRKELIEKDLRISELHDSHKQAQVNLEHFREHSQQQRLIQEEAYQQNIIKLEGEIQQLKRESLVFQQESNKFREENQYQKAVIEKNHESLQEKLVLLEKNEVKLSALHEQLQQIQKESDALKTKAHRQNNELVQITARNSQLEQQAQILNESLSKSLLEKAEIHGRLTQLQNILAVAPGNNMTHQV